MRTFFFYQQSDLKTSLGDISVRSSSLLYPIEIDVY